MSVKSQGPRRIRRDSVDAPEITEKWLAEADLYRGKKLVRRGRPTGSDRKTSLRGGGEAMDSYVVTYKRLGRTTT
jgi:hypothetical protein